MRPLVGELRERRTREALDDPLLHRRGTEARVEPDRRLVPVEHGPLEAPVVPLDSDPRERRHQRTADAASARDRPHEQILEIEAGPAEERRVALEEQRESDGLATELGEQDLRRWLHTEQRRA